jgi:hypothetical protein
MLINGEGKQVTATDTTAIWTPSKSGANGISVNVLYTETAAPVFCLVNCTAAEFDVLYAAGKAIRIQPGTPFNFNGDKLQNISSICYRTATGTAGVDFAAF